MTAPPTPTTAPPLRSGPPPRMKPGHWVLLLIGVLLTVLGAGLTAGGAALAVADAAQREGRYLTGDAERFQSTGYALTSPAVVVDPGEAGMPGAPPIGELVSVQVRATPVVPDQEIFIGLAQADDVTSYLQDVSRTSLGGVSWNATDARPGALTWSDDDAQTTGGNRVPAPPGEQDFWAESASGTGAQEITFDLQPGRWSLVVMNAEATRPVWADVQAGVRTQLLGPIGTGLLIAGLIALVLGVPLLLLGTRGLGRDIDPGGSRRGSGPGAALAQYPGQGGSTFPGYPVRLTGFLDRRLSRGLSRDGSGGGFHSTEG